MNINKEDRLRKDMEMCIEMIVDYLSSIGIFDESIVLCGGFGRGEGAWILNDNQYIPYNDYDFSVITNGVIDYNEIETLRKEMADKVGIKWIDIDIYSRKHFLFMLPTIKNYDFLYASKILYGDAFWKTKKINKKHIGNADICKLLMTRIWTFLGSFSGCFRDLNEQETIFFEYQMAKAILAAIDIALVAHKEYRSSYIEKVEVFNNIFTNEKYNGLSKWAVEIKQNPRRESICKEKMEQLYEDTYEMFFSIIKNTVPCFELISRSKFLLKMYIFTHSRYIVHISREILQGKGTHFRDTIDIFIAQLYTFLDYNSKDNIDYLTKAESILLRKGYIDDSSLDWYEIKDAVASARNEV